MSPREVDALYLELLTKVSARFELLSAHHGQHVTCAEGCHSCCHPSLTVSEVEARLIASHLSAHPDLRQRALKLERSDPHHGARCAFLSAQGRCEIYEVRPVVCRSFGVPLIQIEDPSSGEASLAICELNFASAEGLTRLQELEPSEWLDSAQTDQVLAQLCYHLSSALRGGEATARVPLTPSALS